jgi:hypothetical protein
MLWTLEAAFVSETRASDTEITTQVFGESLYTTSVHLHLQLHQKLDIDSSITMSE